MKNEAPRNEIDFYCSIGAGAGDRVEVSDKRGIFQMHGTIETAAPHLGIVWIRAENGERRLLVTSEHLIRPWNNRNPDWHYVTT